MHKRIAALAIGLILSFVNLAFATNEETFILETYYPAPYGEYVDLYVSDNVGIATTNPQARLEVNGNIVVNGNIKAVPVSITGGSSAKWSVTTGIADLGYDLAELFETNEDVGPADVLVIGENGKLQKCHKTYDVKVAGVVSDAPAVLFEGSQLQIAPTPFEFKKGNKPPVALAGRVYVKVTNSAGAIRPGDLLTTSNIAGHAMAAKKKIPGCILGKALEYFNEKKGKIKVLVTLQ